MILEVLVFILLGFPNLFLSLQLIFGTKKAKCKDSDFSGTREPCTILIPAHNEANIIIATLTKLKDHIRSGDRVLVIADNCTDNTANFASSCGVHVLVRNNPILRGKGYALNAGLAEARKYLTETIVIFDADCQFEPGALDKIVLLSQKYDSVIQGQDLMIAPVGASINTHIAEFAWYLRNSIRPEGQRRLGLGCQLHGTGMAFPLKVFDYVSLASGNLVEDLELGLNLRRIGFSPIFEPSATIISNFPTNEKVLKTQRTRWEHGHLIFIYSLIPKLVGAIVEFKLKDIMMIIDLMIPPITLWLLINTFSVFLLVLGSSYFEVKYLIMLYVLYALQIFSLWMAWYFRGREILPTSELIKVFIFVADKLSIYKAFISNREKKWVKTKRE